MPGGRPPGVVCERDLRAYFLVSLLVVSAAPGVLGALGAAAPGFEESSAFVSALVSVFGEAAGLEAAAPVSAAAPLLASTPSLVIVSVSMRPVAFRPSLLWKSLSAAWVLGPILPSISPGSWPLSLSACWTARTCSVLPPLAMWPPFAPLADFMPSDFIESDDFMSGLLASFGVLLSLLPGSV